MNETTATIQTIHDTVRVVSETQGFTLKQQILGGLVTLASGGIAWLAKYLFHDRKKAKETAFVKTIDAEAEAEVKLTKAEARSQIAVHRSTEETIKFWEGQALKLDAMAQNYRTELAVLQSQAAESERNRHIAEGRLIALKERYDALLEENQRLKERIESDREMLAELPTLRNQVQTLLAKCDHLQQEVQSAYKLVQP